MPEAIREAKEIIKPDDNLTPMTCPWAQDGLKKAMDGMVGSSTGVIGYTIGSRKVQYRSIAEQGAVVSWWQKMVELLCGGPALPSSITGRDTAFRVVPRDV
jgi:hypothetical protein